MSEEQRMELKRILDGGGFAGEVGGGLVGAEVHPLECNDTRNVWVPVE